MWHQKVVQRFESVDKESSKEKNYYPAYDKLLNSIFPFDSDFTVSPQTYPYDNNGSIYFVVEYTIEFQNMPVFVLEIKPGNTLKYYSKREEADIQIRRRLRDLVDECPIDILYGLSCFGENICLYNIEKDSKIIKPKLERNNVEVEYPKDNWERKIMESYSYLNPIFEYIKSSF